MIRLYGVFIRLVLLMHSGTASAGKAQTPHFKWGQTKDLIFLSVMVRELDKDSISVTLVSEGDLAFKAKNTKGEEHVLNLPLREDVNVDLLKWELPERSDKWGWPVLITLSKQNQHRWDLLTSEPKKFKGLMDKDWSREDQTLEPEEETAYQEDNSAHLMALTEKNLEKTVKKFSAVFVNVRYPWCTQCKSQDDTFAKAAKSAKAKGKKDKKWKNVAFAVLDAREQRRLARQLGAKCDYTCEYKVYSDPGEDPVTVKSKWSEQELLDDLVKYLSTSVQVVKSQDEVASLKERNTTCHGGFASDMSKKYLLYKKVASLNRGKLVFLASVGEEKEVEMWPHGQNFSFKYDGSWQDNGTDFNNWVKPRAVPLLQQYDWQLRETYEQLQVPLAKVWIDDKDDNPSFEKIVRHAVRRVAKKYIGQIAFVEQKKSTYSYELRDYGLNQPEVYPAFGIASNASYNSIKYGLEIERDSDASSSAQGFWKDAHKAIAKLSEFCDKVLAGTWPQAHESGAPHKNWTKGEVKRLTWKTFAEVQKPETSLLLEVYGKWRQDNEQKQVEADNLAKVFAGNADSLTIARYDTSDNYLPRDSFTRDKYSSDTEWYWIPKAEGIAGMKKLMKPKKDAPIKNVVEFLKKQSAMDFDVASTMEQFDGEMKANPPPEKPKAPDMGDMGGAGGMAGLGGMDGLEGMAGMDGLGSMGGGEL